MPDRPRAWAIAVLVAAVLVGAAAGWELKDLTGDLPEPRYRETGAMVTYLAHELGLSKSQQDSVRAVLRRHRPELEAIRNLVRARFDSLRTTMQSEISAQLTSAQQQRYRDLLARVERQDQEVDSAGKEHK
ncbi:MAG: hypothetical protein DMD49_05765 [Gemmatimonadetes bacterium]|nr:MAG: hypothetical protein DMD28_12280 [Gemmatimonadota bacterium]PYP32496.1 MAG: hypothetical protein DMD49_05765 [Gemmatimonadota bacterium]